MEYQIKEFAGLSGVSVRTLHYYDEIGLLKPSRVDSFSGYRFYNEQSVTRMQEILFFRELDFPLKDISEIFASKNYDRKGAMKKQRELLSKKRERLTRLIDALDRAGKGETDMSFDAFDSTEYDAKKEEYAKEVKERYGATDAYKENEKKWSGITKEEQQNRMNGLNEKMREFSLLLKAGESATGEKAKKLAASLQAYITENFYTCTNEILQGLGQSYVADERFRKSIDKNGEGTAEFISKAIDSYCLNA